MKLDTDKSIDRIEKPSYEVFYRDYVLKEKPVIVCGALDNWAALYNWTPDYFRDNYGDKIVSLADKDIKLGDFVDQISDTDELNKPAYLKNVFIRQDFQEIAADIESDFVIPAKISRNNK